MVKRTVALPLGHEPDKHPLQAGIDESGRGTLIGPVFAAAVVLDPAIPVPLEINDSKKLSRNRRAQMREWIEKNAIAWRVASRHAGVVDTINIYHATQQAMREALDSVLETCAALDRPITLCIVDGDTFRYRVAGLETLLFDGGDGKYANIAAASILAKEHHDEHIRALLSAHPALSVYGLETNMGYATKKHIDAVREHGPTEFHRKTFAKVREWVPKS